MIKVEDIGWGSYREYEGPVFWGKQKHVLSAEPSQGERILSVICETEGGAYDAYNGYDKCVCTSGLIQWCDRAPWFLVTKILGTLAAEDPALVAPVIEFVSALGYTFGITAKGEWRFWTNEKGTLVDSVEAQQRLYLGGSTGKKGEWSSAQIAHAKRWAAACSSVWQEPRARAVQRNFTLSRLRGFATSSAHNVLLAADDVKTPVALAFQAAYLSFAANNPRKASDALDTAISKVGVRWTSAWLTAVLQHLTFDPGIAIYPHRYNRIRPVLEKLYGLDLPDFSAELPTWMKQHRFEGLLEPRELQQALLLLDYDIGPAGADGVFGKRTQAALMQFEKNAKLPEVFQDGYPDQHTVRALDRALADRGTKLTWRLIA